jgi:cytochrome c-type biogenesis protein CcmF
VVGEFWRGGRVISRQQGTSILNGMVVITRRNTRRYGGYIVHFGIVVIMIGFAGLPFDKDKEQEMGFGDKMQIGAYTLVCKSYTQDDKPNYESEWAVIDVYKGGKQIDTMFPERRFYKASEQTATIVANRSRLNEDLYLVYTGRNQDTGKPILKAHINPLVMWIWIGVNIVLIGTLLSLVPNAHLVKVMVPQKERAAAEAAPSGAVGVSGD